MATTRPMETISGSILQQLERDSTVDFSLQGMNALSRISIASPEQILNWSRRYCRNLDRRAVCKCGKTGEEIENCAFGEVKKPETINYRTFKPEKDGLFCERIFGPVKDWECACGKYKRIKYKGIVCDRCGVEVIESKVRRHRMGHIKLAAPVCHIWFYKGTSSRIASLLDVSVRDLQKVIYFQEYIVVDAGDSPLKNMQLLSEEEAKKYQEIYDDKVSIKIGAEAIQDLLGQIETDSLCNELSLEMRKATSTQKRTKIIKRLKVVNAFVESNNKPDWMVLAVLPVIPPDLRPLVHLDGGRFATSDLNDLYRRVINRNNRLKRLMELRAPDVILRNEKRMLQEAVDALFDNSRRSRPTKGHNNRPLKSLSDMLKGKQGRFRQNLLGKRVDYSGRSVIVVGPNLKFNECGLPKKMALELFDPFIIHELEKRGYVNTIKAAKKMMEREDPVVYDILDDIIQGHPVMLNRAPTLHRLGIQAFLPRLVEGKAIRLHPLACAAFNADFDGDQMAVHIPLSTEAVLETKMIMLAQNNILSPSSGKPVATPSQDIVLGLFYLTKMIKGLKGEGMIFSSGEECISAHNQGVVDLQAEVKVRLEGRIVDTSPGRIIFARVLPEEISYFDEEWDFAGEVLTKKIIGRIAHEIHKMFGAEPTATVLDAMKDLGFEYAKRGGISICIDDMLIPDHKAEILDSSRAEALKVVGQWEKGVLTANERYNKVIDIWTHATETMASEMMNKLKTDRQGMNPILIMSVSGARGNEQQIRQLAGMRGLMQKPTKKISGGVGEIIETPITSNFREGLTVLEYFISTHGARKGLADTALKTSDAGYLTRRLVDVVQDLIITLDDCGTYNGITLTAIKEVTPQGERVLECLGDRLAGRCPVNDVLHPDTGEVICQRNEMITEEIAMAIEDAGVEEVLIRSVLTCERRRGICAKCYGRNMATGFMVDMGEAVGVIAAQSIGEPGTQLTLRTFHIGGTASVLLEGWYQATAGGTVRLKGIKFIERKDPKTKKVELIVINRTGTVQVQDQNGTTVQVLPNIPYGATISKKDGEKVDEGDTFIRWNPQVTPILAEVSGKIKFHDIVPGVTMKEEVDPVTEQVQKIISEHREELHPQLHILDSEGEVISQHTLSASTILSPGIQDDKVIAAGDILARIPRAVTKSRDITGGLPRVDELFEARKPKDQAVISEIDGKVAFRGISKGARKIAVVSESGDESLYTIPHARHIQVRDGEEVHAGDQVTDGSVSPHDILAVQGEKAVQEFLLGEIQKVYRLQGVTINDKHIEAIIRQMLKKVIVEEVGNTSFLYGQQVDKFAFQEENDQTVAKGGEPARAKPKLLGLTKASLETDSFISAASFQETTRVLTDAAVRGRVDHLRGLKENVIMGLLIPAGTGLPRYRNIELESDQQVEEDVEIADEEQEPVPVAAEEKAPVAEVEAEDEDDEFSLSEED